MEKIIEEDILFSDKNIFGDNEEHSYDVECYDGYGVATANEEGIPKKLKVTYPTLSVVLKDEGLCRDILKYRGLHDLDSNDIHYGDVMMCFGEISF